MVTYLKATRDVTTLAAAAQRILQFAFIYVAADFSCGVHFVTTVADATIGPHKIFAAAVYADIRILRALVDVCSNGSITAELLLLAGCGFSPLKSFYKQHWIRSWFHLLYVCFNIKRLSAMRVL